MTDWNGGESDDFFMMFLAIMIINLLNFLMNIFSLYMHVKMSSAQWTMKSKSSKEAKQTTQMDREIAAGCYDSQMLDFDF